MLSLEEKGLMRFFWVFEINLETSRARRDEEWIDIC